MNPNDWLMPNHLLHFLSNLLYSHWSFNNHILRITGWNLIIIEKVSEKNLVIHALLWINTKTNNRYSLVDIMCHKTKWFMMINVKKLHQYFRM